MKTIEAIETIINSPLLEQYLIGITADSKQRKRNYKSVGFDCYAILETGLNREEALNKEEYLFNELTSNKSNIYYKKYHI